MKGCEFGPCGSFHKTSFSSYLTNGPNRLVFHNTKSERVARDKHSSLLGSFLCYEENKILIA